jgi:uncharacterized protein (DUF433 family)
VHAETQTPPTPGRALGAGIYPAGEAARLAELEPQRLRRWMAGYTFRGRMGERRASSPVFKNEAQHEGQRLVLSFLDLIEACFVKVFLDRGVSLHTIRIVAQEAEVMFKTTHPFCVKKFETDGETILARLRDEQADGGERLLDLKRKHFVFPAVFNPLLKTLDYDTSGDAIRWWPRGKGTPVVLDPQRAFGAAIVERSCVPTRALFDAHTAGETSESIAKWFRVDLDEVRAAIAFEKSLRRPVAHA